MKKRMLAMFLIICMVLTMLPMGALAEKTPPATSAREEGTSFTVTFHLNGGVGTASPQTVTAGGSVREPADISKDGFTLEGWYQEESFENRWDFNKHTVSEDMTLFAKWNEDSPAPALKRSNTVGSEEDPVNPLEDNVAGVAHDRVNPAESEEDFADPLKDDSSGTAHDPENPSDSEDKYDNALEADNSRAQIMSAADEGVITVTTKEELVAAMATGVSGNVVLGADITNVNHQLTIERDVTLDLNGHKLTIVLGVDEGNCNNGIKISSNVTFTIKDSSASEGELSVTTYSNYNLEEGKGAAINTTDGTLVIDGGTVFAKSGNNTAGIGGGMNQAGGTVIINGGSVTAIGGWDGAGIGGGKGQGGTVRINGGTTKATGGTNSAGIGGGGIGINGMSNGGSVEINGGVVIANGYEGGAGIGGGTSGAGGSVKITGGTVVANGSSAASIGSGINRLGNGTLTITGGSVKMNNRAYSATPKNSDGIELYLANLMVREDSTVLSNTKLDSTGHFIRYDDSDYLYGTKDLVTDDTGSLLLWLPANTYEISMMAGGVSYSSSSVIVTNKGCFEELRKEGAGTNYQQLLREAAANGGTYELPVSFDGQPGNELALRVGLDIKEDFTLDLNGRNLTIVLEADVGNLYNGIKIFSGVTFTIKDSSKPSTGSLNVKVSAHGASGNGAAINTSEGTLVIESGTVVAHGGAYAAGIGTGFYTGGTINSGGRITINGGNVSAIGGAYGAGIGCGSASDYARSINALSNGGIITITGGTVEAKGGAQAAGIGGGLYTKGGVVNISGGTVTATGSTHGAGIGSGYNGYGAEVTISGGTVIANGGNSGGAGIGSGSYNTGTYYYGPYPGTLEITGGSVYKTQATSTGDLTELGESANAMRSDTSPSTALFLTTLTLKNNNGEPVGNTALSSGMLLSNQTSFAYGTADVKTNAEGKVYFWLPAATYSISLKTGGTRYFNSSVPSGSASVLTASTAPSSISLFGNSIAINAAAGTQIGTFTTTDADGDDSFTYSLVPGEGSTHNSLFEIFEDSLRLRSELAPDTPASLSIRVRTTDPGDAYYEKVFSIKVINYPGAPTITNVEAGDKEVTVYFTAPVSNGGDTITSYTVTAEPDGATASGASSPITVKGLTNGQAYTFTVTATNSVGKGAASAPSDEITPNSAPVVTSVGVPAAKTYGRGEYLDFTVKFDQAVTVTGVPQIALTIGSTTCYALYREDLGNESDTALVFRYTVQDGLEDDDGITVGKLSLNGGTIQNLYKTNAELTLNNMGSAAGVCVDTIAPVVSSVSVPANDTYALGEALSFTVYFSENVTVTGMPQLSITIGSSTVGALYDSGSGSSQLVFKYTVQAGQEDKDGIEVGSLTISDATIKDVVGNDATLTLNNVASTKDVFVDGIAPSAPIVLSWESDTGMSNTDGITNDTTPTIVGTAEAQSNVTLFKGTTVLGSTTADADGNWSITLSELDDGTYDITAKAADAVGNVSAPSDVIGITVDTQAPSLSIVPADGAMKVSTSGKIVLTFSERMDSLSSGAVQLNATALTGAWSADNTVYTIQYSKLSGGTSYTLTIADFHDIAGNKAANVTSSFTTAKSSSGGGSSYLPTRTLVDRSTGITVSGALSDNATLHVKSFTPPTTTTDPALAAIRKRMDNTTDKLIFCADITVSGSYSGPLTLSFEVGSQYNGQMVTLLHAKDGILITYTAIVQNGIVTFTVTSLSPFALFVPTAPYSLLSIPKTGDASVPYEAIAMLSLFVLLVSSIVGLNHRRNRKGV